MKFEIWNPKSRKKEQKQKIMQKDNTVWHDTKCSLVENEGTVE